VYVMTSHVSTQFYRFDPDSSAWQRLPAEIRGLPIVGLTYLASDGCLYALEYESGDRALRRIQRFNTEGASLGAVDLHPVVPVGSEGLFQLQTSGDRLILILPPLATEPVRTATPAGASTGNRTFVVDPKSGEVFVPDATR
jgi:hypothetical protein